MTREEMWKEFENQLIRETRTPITMSFDNAEKLTKLGIEETVEKWKRRLEQTRWIPVSERLPEDFQRVLVTVVNYKGDKVVRVAEYNNWKGVFKIKENNEQWEVGEKGLLAWMPLPQPYKGESEE